MFEEINGGIFPQSSSLAPSSCVSSCRASCAPGSHCEVSCTTGGGYYAEDHADFFTYFIQDRIEILNLG